MAFDKAGNVGEILDPLALPSLRIGPSFHLSTERVFQRGHSHEYSMHVGRDRTGWEIIASFLVLGAYGVAWSYLLAPAGHDRLAVFWSTLMMMGYVVAGLWRGPFFAVCGLVGTALSFAAFFFAGPWLHLWIGAIYAFGFVLGGLWLYRIGAGD